MGFEEYSVLQKSIRFQIHFQCLIRFQRYHYFVYYLLNRLYYFLSHPIIVAKSHIYFHIKLYKYL